MEFVEFWKLLGLGFEVDFEKRAYTIKLGPLTLKGLPFKTVKALSSTPLAIEMLLSEHFIQRGVMWEDFRRETVDDCIKSLRDLQRLSQAKTAEFEATKKVEDQVFASILRAWANECDEAVTMLQSALEDERDPINTGMDISAKDAIPDSLGKLRKSTYPFVAMFIDLLPETSPVKAQAVERLRYGKDILVKFFNVSASELVPPGLEIETI